MIFICESDYIGAGKPTYTIRRKVEETGEVFEDDAVIIYVNGELKNHDTALGRLMEDFSNPDPETMNYDLLADKARLVKDIDDKGGDGMKIVREYLTEDEWNAALKEGRELGKEIGEDRGINNMICDNIDENVPIEKIIIKLGRYYNLQPEEARKRIEKEMESRQVF